MKATLNLNTNIRLTFNQLKDLANIMSLIIYYKI